MQTPNILSLKPIYINYNCNNIKTNNLLQPKALHFKRKELINDTFEPSSRFNNNKDDYDTIIKSVKEENFIGSGEEGNVYKMDNPNYVIKIPKKIFKNNILNITKNNLKEEEITEQDKVNHVVKKYENGITIMKKIAGESISSLEDINEVADLPVKSYQNLLNQIIDAGKKGMEFDFAMNNVLYDKETKSLTAIDFKPYTNCKYKIEPLFKIFFVLDSFKKPYEKKILGKILSAALNNMKSDKEQKIQPYEYDYNKILDILEYNNQKDLVDIIKLKKCIDKIVLNKIKAKTKCQKTQVDNYIDYTLNFINSKLINEFEQA